MKDNTTSRHTILGGHFPPAVATAKPLHLRCGLRCGTLLLVSLLLLSSNGFAREDEARIGLTAGYISPTEDRGNFRLLTLNYSRPILEPVSLGRFRIHPRISASIGALSDNDETAAIASFGPDFMVRPYGAGSRWFLQVGVHPTFLSEDNFGRKRLGGFFQFTSHAAVGLDLSQHASLLLRIQHTSNADIFDENDGLDILAVSLENRF